MSDIISRKIITDVYLSHRTSRNACRYEASDYKIWIPYNCLPNYESVTIVTCFQGKVKERIILNSELKQDNLSFDGIGKGKNHICPHKDMSRIGEFIFLLAAKFKRDILHGIKEENAGFLHTDVIKKLNHDHLTNVPFTIYTSRNHVFNNSKEFLKQFLIEPSQIFHLLCCWGLTGKKSQQKLVWWLNTQDKNIIFQDENQEIDSSNLKNQLDKLFPEEVLRDESETMKQFSDLYIERNSRTPKASEAKKNIQIIKPEKFQIKEFREKLKQRAIEHLNAKLHDKGMNDYRPLRMEIGLPKTKDYCSGENGNYSIRYDHARKWQDFDFKQFYNPKGIYILSSETGSGKTTFLRNLQLTLIDKTDKIPLFIEASDLEGIDFRNGNRNNFLKGIVNLFNGYLGNGYELEFLMSYFDKVVFLIDGLDQIRGTGTEYNHFVDNLLDMIKTNLIITSRPFAVIEKESDSELKFIRLKDFNERDKEIYFGEYYSKAKTLCKTCIGMLSVPMLAYMIRLIITNNRYDGIFNRADLYFMFVKYIFEDYLHENFKVSEGKKVKMLEALTKMSFCAIAKSETYLQKIPISFAVNSLPPEIEIDELFKFGMINLMIVQSKDTKKFIYFSHQSFQEYLAAEYISQNDSRIQQVLAEKWNPKWKEVIKFLTGRKGQGIIKKILEEKDNPIYSQLFLSAELIQETTVNPDLRNQIWDKLELLFKGQEFIRDASLYGAYVNEAWIVNELVRRLINEDTKVRDSVNAISSELGETLIAKIIQAMLEKFNEGSASICWFCLDFFMRVANKVDDVVIATVAQKYNDAEEILAIKIIFFLLSVPHIENTKIMDDILENIDKAPIDAQGEILNFVTIKSDISNTGIYKIAGMLDSEYSNVRYHALYVICGVINKVEHDVIEKIVDLLEDKDKYVQIRALEVLEMLNESRVNSRIVNKFNQILKRKDVIYQSRVLCKINWLSDDIQSGKIEQFANMLENEDPSVRCSALLFFNRLEEEIDGCVYDKIASKLNDEKDIDVYKLILEFFSMFNDIESEIIEKIVLKLDDKSDDFRYSALLFFVNFEGEIEDYIIGKIMNKFNDNNNGVQCLAINFFRNNPGKISDEVFEKILIKLDDKQEDIQLSAIEAILECGDKVNKNIIEKVINKIKNGNGEVLTKIGFFVVKMQGKLDVDDIKKIIKALWDKKNDFLGIFLSNLVSHKDKVEDTIMWQIINMLEEEVKYRSLLQQFVNVLIQLKEHINGQMIKKLVEMKNIYSIAVLKDLYQEGKLEFLK